MADYFETLPIPRRRLDELAATILQSREHVVPAMKDGVSVKLTVAQILGLIAAGDLAGKVLADAVGFTPDSASPLEATNVAAALEEIAGDYLRADQNGADILNTSTFLTNIGAPLQGYLVGLTLSNAADTEHDITVAVGRAASDGVSPLLMPLAGALTKQADATFATGDNAGGMVSGEGLPTSGTVHVWLIMKADGTTDVCFNNNASSGLSPTLPTDFIYKRRIGSLRTDSSANIWNFIQNGDDFAYKAYKQDVAAASQGSSPTTRSLTVPQGLKVQAKITFIARGAADGNAIVYDPDLGSISAGGSATDLFFIANTYNSTFLLKYTNASGQVNTANTAASGGLININTWGYIDRRGRDA